MWYGQICIFGRDLHLWKESVLRGNRGAQVSVRRQGRRLLHSPMQEVTVAATLVAVTKGERG